MITLTTLPQFAEVTSPNIRAQSRAWNRLLPRLRRQYGPFDWAWVREHNSGRNLHLHLLCTITRAPKTQFSLLAAKSGFGISDIRPIRTPDNRKRQIAYITKSLRLLPTDPDGAWPPRTRHYRTSIPKPIPNPKELYDRIPNPEYQS